MGITLDDKNLDKIVRELPVKGFSAKFWQDHRSKAASGSGVAKCLARLKNLGVPPSGDPSEAPLEKIDDIIIVLGDLYRSLGKAEGKARGRFFEHTKKFCAAFIKVVEKRESEALKLRQHAAKIKAARARELAETDKKLRDYKKQQETMQELVLDELAELDTRARNMATACRDILTDLKLAAKDVGKLHHGLTSQMNPDGLLPQPVADRFEKGLLSMQKKYNLPLHGANLKNSLPKILTELTGAFPQYFKLDYAKKERLATGKSIKEAQDGLQAAKKALQQYAEAHKSMAKDLKKVAA